MRAETFSRRISARKIQAWKLAVVPAEPLARGGPAPREDPARDKPCASGVGSRLGTSVDFDTSRERVREHIQVLISVSIVVWQLHITCVTR